MKQIFTVLLYPLSILYDLGTRYRNHLYNISHKKSFRFDTTVIGVGNLSVGGTGKTPVVEYILRLLDDRKVATLSRGYGRKTKGFRIADQKDDAITLGDEPFQFYQKFGQVMVTVGEDRAMAIPQILYHGQGTEVIILDDAYQHRSVIPNLNILLTVYERPFFKDHLLPAGRLREARKNANRADIVIVTKCPHEVEDGIREKMIHRISQYTRASVPIFFSQVNYLPLKQVYGEAVLRPRSVYLFTGIANEKPFTTYIGSQYDIIGQQHFSDHFQYRQEDVEHIIEQFDKLAVADTVIVTTEKDMVRLLQPAFEVLFGQRPVYYVPIEVSFQRDGALFDQLVLDSIKTQSILE